MKALVIASLVLAGSIASARTCVDTWGNTASVRATRTGASISSARYGSTGVLAANGESSDLYYYRGGMGDLIMVQKSVVAGGPGRVTFEHTKDGRGDTAVTYVLYCR